MLLEQGLINITRNLEVIINGHSGEAPNISSHVTIKERGLKCLKSLIEQAPTDEYHHLLTAPNHEILLGYLMSVLCKLAKDDKSRSIRQAALDTLVSLLNKLEHLHDFSDSNNCSINLIRTSLPGVSSSLFQLIMSDTRLPKSLIEKAIYTLSRVISLAFKVCSHELKFDVGELEKVCENLGIRINFLLDYVINKQSELSITVISATLKLCQCLIHETKIELIRKTVNSIIRFLAFTCSLTYPSEEIHKDVESLTRSLQDLTVRKSSGQVSLDSEILSALIKLCDNLQEHGLTMLHSERESQISLLSGYLKLLQQDSLVLFFEIDSKGHQLVRTLIKLVEFSLKQPFLFLTDIEVSEKALEMNIGKLYTVEKRFAHLTSLEVELINNCCQLLGQNLGDNHLEDLFRSELVSMSSPNNLYISHAILKGCVNRRRSQSLNRFIRQMISRYVTLTQDVYLQLNKSIESNSMDPKDVLAVVISIETIVSLIQMHMDLSESRQEKILTLQVSLCPMLNWASSFNRAVSEASLNGLGQITSLYQYDSIKSLLEDNIDFIVDGVSRMLDTFVHNPEITSVLAITFKLSSIDSLYFFNDIFERIFKMIGIQYTNEKCRPIAILFNRTLEILKHWKEALKENTLEYLTPLSNESSVKEICDDISIDRRLRNIEASLGRIDEFRRRCDVINSNSSSVENRVLEEIKSNKLPDDITRSQHEPEVDEQDDQANKKSLAPEIVLTEKIMTHCIGLISSNDEGTKVFALKALTCGFWILAEDENTLLPIVHQTWNPLIKRLNSDIKRSIEVSLCAFECLMSMAFHAKDFIKRRTLDSIIPRICLFLESHENQSRSKREYEPYCMTVAYKCQLAILRHIGSLAYHIQLGYTNLWRIIEATLPYLDSTQVPALREAAHQSLMYLMALDADCVWYFAKKHEKLRELPFELIFVLDNNNS